VQRVLDFVFVRLTLAAQVYGGSMSFVVGAYLLSYSDQYYATSSAGDTMVSGLSMVFDNNRISGSQAVTSTIRGALLALNPTFQMHAHVRVNFVDSIRTQVLLQAPTYVVISDYCARCFSFDVMPEQAIGGTVAIVAGAFVYTTLKTSKHGKLPVESSSSSSAGDTVLSGVLMLLNNNRISDSQAVTSTEGSLHAPNPTFQMLVHARVSVFHSI